MIRRKPKRAKSRPLCSPSRVTLSDTWRAWIVENAASGASREELVQTLANAGILKQLASAEVDAILTSPALAGCKQLWQRAERAELALRLSRVLASQATNPQAIERRETLHAKELYDDYYSVGRPVVLTKMIADWPAIRKWSPEYFAERFGQVEIEVIAGRDADPYWDRRMAEHRQTLSMATYCERVRSSGETNDFYLVSNNRAFERPELCELLGDLDPPADIFDVPLRAGSASLWFGPAGTHTPLHHDLSNILICQIYGKKRFTLVAPFSPALLQNAEGYYASSDWEARVSSEEDPLPVRTVELSPGEALFLPAGYWHDVKALSPSIHVSLLAFRRPNSMGFYRPTFVGKEE